MTYPDAPAWLRRWQQAKDDVLLYVDQTLLLPGALTPDEQYAWAQAGADTDTPVALVVPLLQARGIPSDALSPAMRAVMRQYYDAPGQEEDGDAS